MLRLICVFLGCDMSIRLEAAEFRVDSIKHDDKQVHYYTGVSLYRIFKACFDFLGPVASNLTYWDPGKVVETHDKLDTNIKRCCKGLYIIGSVDQLMGFS